jgi:Uma2 family endonuclease
MTTFEYLSTEETSRRRELTYGVLREPPAPFYDHQRLVFRIARLLHDHVEPRGLGQVVLAPLDVVLDRDAGLVLQPDVLFVSSDRRSIIRDQVWGAPDLVVEVLSAGTQAYDRGQKLGWYRQYGVSECWLVDPAREAVVVVDFTGADPIERIAHGTGLVRSSVLPALHMSASALFR